MKRFLLLVLASCSPFSGAGGSDSNVSADATQEDGGVSGGDMSLNADVDAAPQVSDASPGTDAGIDADPGACDGAPAYTHNATVGAPTNGTWTDCVPLDTYTQDQAMKACVAFCTSAPASNAPVRNCQCSLDLFCDGGTMAVSEAGVGWSWSGLSTGEAIFAVTGCSVLGGWN